MDNWLGRLHSRPVLSCYVATGKQRPHLKDRIQKRQEVALVVPGLGMAQVLHDLLRRGRHDEDEGADVGAGGTHEQLSSLRGVGRVGQVVETLSQNSEDEVPEGVAVEPRGHGAEGLEGGVDGLVDLAIADLVL